MDRLVLMDVSAIVYTMHFSLCDKEYQGHATEGIFKVMSYLCTSYFNRDTPVLVFDSRTVRHDIQGYKANRKSIPTVKKQIDNLYKLAKYMGITTLKLDGYEADDLIYYASAVYKDNYDEVLIRTHDKDIVYSLSSGRNISILNCVAGRPDYTHENTGAMLGVAPRYVALDKFCKGDSSDYNKVAEFPGMNASDGFFHIANWMEENVTFHEQGSVEQLREYLKIYKVKDAEKRITIFYPIPITDELIPELQKIANSNKLNLKRWKDVVYTLNFKKLKVFEGGETSPEVGNILSEGMSYLERFR